MLLGFRVLYASRRSSEQQTHCEFGGHQTKEENTLKKKNLGSFKNSLQVLLSLSISVHSLLVQLTPCNQSSAGQFRLLFLCLLIAHLLVLTSPEPQKTECVRQYRVWELHQPSYSSSHCREASLRTFSSLSTGVGSITKSSIWGAV